MKKLFSFLIIVIATSGCKKKYYTTIPATPADDPRFYIEYTTEDSTVRYTTNTGALRENPSICTSYGYEHFGENANGIKLQFFSLNIPNGIVPGTYTDTANNAGGSGEPYDLRVYLQRGGTVYSSNKFQNTLSKTPCVATITSINADSITGTFHGRVYFGSNYLDIKNGKFCSDF